MLVFKLCPELGDGQSSSIVADPDDVASAIREWAKARKDGNEEDEMCTIETVEMTEADFDALPML